jgi:hypothetical protein
MKKKLFLAGILGMVLVFGFLFSGCASTQPIGGPTSTQPIVGPNPFVGTWESTGAVIFTVVFNANGTGTYTNYRAEEFTYTVDGNTAEITTKLPRGTPPTVPAARYRVQLTDDGLSMSGQTYKKK